MLFKRLIINILSQIRKPVQIGQHCTVTAHHSIADCLYALENIKEVDHGNDTCLFSRLKCAIIAARRHYPEFSFGAFAQDVENHIELICQHFNTRWIISLVDTYADYGNPIEQRNAMMVSIMFNWEKLAQTERLLHPPGPAPEDLSLFQNPQPLFDGTTIFVLSPQGDMINNLFRRTHCLLSDTPIIYMLFREILTRASLHHDFTLSIIAENHPRDILDNAVNPTYEIS